MNIQLSEVTINPEFKKLIPPLSKEEYAQLEKNIIQDGCRDPLVTWNNTLIDGHNRYEICVNHNIPFEVVKKEFESNDHILIWIIENQEGRRNLSEPVKFELQIQKKEAENRIGNNKKELNLIQNRNVNVDKSEPINTREKLAKATGVSAGTFHKMETVYKQSPEIWDKVKSGETSVDRAFKQVKHDTKKAERSELAAIGSTKKIEIEFRHGDFETVLSNIPDGSIDCIITDPPYPYEDIECWTKLSRFSRRVLKPNGYCIAYSGQMYLPEVMQRMCEYLDYSWTFACYHTGGTAVVHAIGVMNRWKPVLIFQNGKKKLPNTFQDYFVSEGREKDGHDWQQSISGAEYLIEMFTLPGDVICEPFAGSGTTIRAAIAKGRGIIAAEIDHDSYNITKALL